MVFLEGSQLFLDALALDLVLKVFVLFHGQHQFVQAGEVTHCHHSSLYYIIISNSFALHPGKPSANASLMDWWSFGA